MQLQADSMATHDGMSKVQVLDHPLLALQITSSIVQSRPRTYA